MKYTFTIFMISCLIGSVCIAREIYVHVDSQAESPDGSEDMPFKLISDAITNVQGGDTIIIRAGIYRESVSIPSGLPDKPVSIKAADGERVVISGAIPVTGWRKYQGNVYMTEIDFRPERLLLNYRLLPIAREPDEGWWVASDANDLTIMDAQNLKTLSEDPIGGEAYIWVSSGNTFFTVPIDSIDRVNGRFTVIRKSQWMELNAGDRYYLKNHPSFIDSPGDWAVQEEGGKYYIYYQPVSLDDLNAVEAPHKTRPVVSVRNAEHVRITGLEVVAGANNGIEVNGAGDVIIADCIVHNHGYMGVLLRSVKDVIFRNNISLDNYCGLALHTASDVVVEENEIARNTMDGLIVSYNSANITVQRNYIHHHLLWGHPDNIQLYYDVTNIHFIDNLILAGGQSMMMAMTSNGLIKGNMIIGSRAYSLIFGHKSAENYRIHNNTIAFCGIGCISLTARDYDLRENVIMSGHSGCLVALRDAERYTGDRNLFFNAHALDSKIVMASSEGFHRSFEHYQRATGYDSNSVYSDPMFRNAPNAISTIDHRRLADCTNEVLYLGGGTDLFRLGDVVEIDFDGVSRTVIDRNNAAITISPALQTKPVTACLVCNWGWNKEDLSLDLRLTTKSPGIKLGASGGSVGSTIDIAAYQRGDFNSDGKRDLPPVPPELGLDSNTEQEAEAIVSVNTK